MVDFTKRVPITAFICCASEGEKIRTIFYDVVPAVGSLIQIGPRLFTVDQVVYPLNWHSTELRADRAIEIFVSPAGGQMYADAENYDEVDPDHFKCKPGILKYYTSKG